MVNIKNDRLRMRNGRREERTRLAKTLQKKEEDFLKIKNGAFMHVS